MIPDRVATLKDVERLLAATTNYEERMPASATPRYFDLARMRSLLDAVSRPERGPTTVHVTGSKGKGSTCRMVDAILRAAGLGPVGLYVSPHLESLLERVSVDGRPIAGVALARATAALLPALRGVEGTAAFPTFFEILTAAAHVAFRDAGVRTVVLEVGLGGRLDATNVCEPAVTAITTVELEHTAILGSTIEAIAREKAGIVKDAVPVVCAVSDTSPALPVIEAAARAARAPLHLVGREIRIERAVASPGPRLDVRVSGPLGRPAIDVVLPVAGEHQASNAAVAIAIARLLGVDDDAIRTGLATVALPGRMEVVSSSPTVVIDGAHTPVSARAARRALDACFPSRAFHLIVGVLEEKDVLGVVGPRVHGAASVIAAGVPSPRALAPERLAAILRTTTRAPVSTAPDAAIALDVALARAVAGDVVLVSGSLYLAGAARAAARKRPGFLPGDDVPGA